MNPTLLAPSLLLSLLLSVAYASLFHLWRGRTLRDFIIYLFAALIGFGAGQLLGALIRLPILQVGEVHVVEATIAAWLALLIAGFATSSAPQRKRATRRRNQPA